MPAPKKQNLVGVTVGRYRITRELGRGGMGVVYEAVHETIGYRAALKVLGIFSGDSKHSTYVARFYDEARAVNLINHPGVVRIFDFGEMPDGTVYIMMEFLEGQTLADRLRDMQAASRRQWTVTQVLRLLHQLSSAMAQAHEREILHRDLKPENMILVRDIDVEGGERVKLLDFGLARFLDSPERRTTAGVALGTPMYMSPEQCMGENLDGKCDVYSTGVIFYELCVGRPPFMADEISKLMLKHINEEPPPIKELATDLPDSLAKLIHSMLSKKAADRPTMAQVLTRVEEILKAGGLPEAEMLPASVPGGTASGPEAKTRMRPAMKAPAATEIMSAASGGATGKKRLMQIAGLAGGGLVLGLSLGLVVSSLRKPPPPDCPPPPPPPAALCVPPPPEVVPPPPQPVKVEPAKPSKFIKKKGRR